MSKTFVKPGKTLKFTAGGTLSSGDGLLIGKLFGVVAGNLIAGQSGELDLVGVFILPKDGSVIAIGVAVYWDGSDVTTTALANEKIGTANLAAAGGAATVEVRLDGIGTVTGA